MSDFSDRELIAGEFRGLRAFDVDALGRLKGPSFGGIFKPGVNEAKCGGDNPQAAALTLMQRQIQQSLNRITFRYVVAGDANSITAIKDEPRPNPHVPAGKDCACGYYAYFDGGNDYAQHDRVTAVIAGTGTVTAGKRGFRASKAELVALVAPGADQRRQHPAWFDRYADWLSGNGCAPLIGVPSGVAGVGTSVASIALSIERSPWFGFLAILGIALALLCGITLKADFHAIDRRYPLVSDLTRCHDGDSKAGVVPWDLVRRNYPNVPVYSSVKAALAAHPLTPPPEPPEPTPADDDFWTRPAVTA